MKIIIYISILLSLLIVISCKDNKPNEPEIINRSITSISAKFNSWNLGADKLIVMSPHINNEKMFAKAKISEEGKFELTNLESSSVNTYRNIYLGVFRKLSANVIDNISWSDTTVNYANGYFDIYDTTMNSIGFITVSSLPTKTLVYDNTSNVGDCFVEFIYCDKDIVIKGTYSSEEHNYYHYRVKCNVDLTFYKGWNKYVTIVHDKRTIIENNKIIDYIEYSYSNNEPDYVIWDYMLF